METFAIQVENPTKKDLDTLSEIMAKVQDETVEYIKQLAKELNVSDNCAMDVYYLRTRSRHTPELEKELIRLHSIGQAPNMCEFR